MLLTLCTNFIVFAHFVLQSSPMKLHFWYLFCKHFPEITHQYILFAPLFLHLKHFQTSALLCVVKGILLDIGLNLRYSLVLQINNFPTHYKKLSPVWNYFRWRLPRNFTLSLNEARKAHYFCFLLLVQNSAVHQNSNKATLPNTKTFSTVRLALCLQSLCLLLHNNFFVFNISDNCWKSSHNLWTLPNHNSRSLEGLGFRACYSVSSHSPTTPFWKGSVYFAATMPTATAWLELLCRQSKILVTWQLQNRKAWPWRLVDRDICYHSAQYSNLVLSVASWAVFPHNWTGFFIAFLLVIAPYCHLSLVLASVVQGDAVNCNSSPQGPSINDVTLFWAKLYPLPPLVTYRHKYLTPPANITSQFATPPYICNYKFPSILCLPRQKFRLFYRFDLCTLWQDQHSIRKTSKIPHTLLSKN